MNRPLVSAFLPALVLVTLGGCDFRAKAAAERKHQEIEAEIAELRERIYQVEEENKDLRARVLAVEEKERFSAPSASGTTTSSTARCTDSGGSYRLSKAAFADPVNALAQGARIVPFFENGASKGFKIFGVRPDSVYSSCGLRNGDVVASINGFPLNNPDAALEAYARLKTAARLDIALLRQGHPETIVIELDP